MENQEEQLNTDNSQGKKAQEQQRRMRDARFNKMKNYIITLIVILALGFFVYWLAQTSGVEGEDHSQAVPVMDDMRHVAVGGSESAEYNSNPPTSGPHYAQTAMSGFRDEVIADGHLIHNLEHGDIWISFHPRVSEAVQEELRKFAGPKVVITPREKNDTDIALVAWGRLDTFDLVDDTLPEQRIKDFIKRYMHSGPEFVPGASGGI